MWYNKKQANGCFSLTFDWLILCQAVQFTYTLIFHYYSTIDQVMYTADSAWMFQVWPFSKVSVFWLSHAGYAGVSWVLRALFGHVNSTLTKTEALKQFCDTKLYCHLQWHRSTRCLILGPHASRRHHTHFLFWKTCRTFEGFLSIFYHWTLSGPLSLSRQYLLLTCIQNLCVRRDFGFFVERYHAEVGKGCSQGTQGEQRDASFAEEQEKGRETCLDSLLMLRPSERAHSCM